MGSGRGTTSSATRAGSRALTISTSSAPPDPPEAPAEPSTTAARGGPAGRAIAPSPRHRSLRGTAGFAPWADATTVSPSAPAARSGSLLRRGRRPRGQAPPSPPRQPESVGAETVSSGRSDDTHTVRSGFYLAPAPSLPRRWTRGDALGAGSFGSVYLGLNSDTGELFAVKEVTLDRRLDASRGDPPAVEQLESARSTFSPPAAPEHRAIRRHRARDDDALYIFLEYVPGGSIASLLDRFGAFEESVAARIRVADRRRLRLPPLPAHRPPRRERREHLGGEERSNQTGGFRHGETDRGADGDGARGPRRGAPWRGARFGWRRRWSSSKRTARPRTCGPWGAW